VGRGRRGRRARGAGAATTDDDKLLTAGEVADLIRVTRAWVYAETRRNAIPHLRLGRYVRYRRSAIEAWMQAVERGPGAATARR
jgi:excisionase family DNA binding protein